MFAPALADTVTHTCVTLLNLFNPFDLTLFNLFDLALFNLCADAADTPVAILGQHAVTRRALGTAPDGSADQVGLLGAGVCC